LRRSHAGRGRAAVAALAAAAAVLSGTAARAVAPPRERPTDGERIVLVLPAGVPRPSGEAGADPDAAAAQAESLLALARETRDARYFGRAEAIVAPWADAPAATPRLLSAAADLAQQRHDFRRARGLLDAALARDPGDAGTLIRRANVALLLGEHAAARRDCAAALQAGAGLAGTICLASALTGPGSVGRARRLLESLDDAGLPPALASWRLATLADLELRDGDARAALASLARAHAIAPGQEETRVRLADALLLAGDGARALPLTEGANPSAGLLVSRIRAASAVDAGRADAARRALEALLEVGRRRGSPPHLREEAALALYVDHDAPRALALARRNFELQKDTPDLRVYADAALAARDREAVAALRRWLASTGFEDRAVAARLGGPAP
jgi:tetratricopeptide (TPR) repeat protein